jgi:dTDP-4-amino-4,6-dideoxygalactose transaminase
MPSIPFNKPFFAGKEIEYIKAAVATGKISGDGFFSNKCHDFFQHRYGFLKPLLTTSCTDALEMSAILADIQPGDEVIVPSYTFVSTANAFVMRGAKIVFIDSEENTPNIDSMSIEALITNKTKAIVPMHYAGIACEMDTILNIAAKYDLYVVEDAAQAIDSYYKGKPLGSLGHFAAFSFHETKNIISGEGGLLVINDQNFIKRAEIIREKGTNRSAFFRGEIDKYGWVDIGSSYLPSDIIAAFLFAQLENIDKIQSKRRNLWNEYFMRLEPLCKKGYIKLPMIPEYATNNGHLFYVLCENVNHREGLIHHLKKNDILSVFHYQSLHHSAFYRKRHDGRLLPNADHYSDCLLRLPLYYELTLDEVDFICNCIVNYFS